MIDETFKEYFKFPLILRENMPYIFGNDGKTALTWLTDLTMEEKEEIVNKINGYSKNSFDKEWTLMDNIFLCYEDKKIMFVRGWGMLTGTGVSAYHLNEHTAKKLQDNFARYILNKLNEKKCN